MNGRDVADGDLLPIGRRVAYWRTRRKLSQQMFADQLGKSKSWVDKVERGVRSLDRVSTIHDIAAILRIDSTVLLSQENQAAAAPRRVGGADRIRAALSTYDVVLGRATTQPAPVPADQLARAVEHVWTAYQHARYPQVAEVLPQLLIDAQRTHALDPARGRVPLVEAYRLAASLLVKLDETDLAWLAADRAMTTATGHRVLAAVAAVQLGQVLRASGRAKPAVRATLTAAYRVAPAEPGTGTAQQLSLCGTLLIQAALAAARHADNRAADDLVDEAAGMADQVGDGHDHYRTAFGPTAVTAARTAIAVELNDGRSAVAWHETTIGRDGWRWLPAEHRAAHLLDAARSYLLIGDAAGAGRVLVEANHTAPAEMRCRPTARQLLAQAAHDADAPAALVQLATALAVA